MKKRVSLVCLTSKKSQSVMQYTEFVVASLECSSLWAILAGTRSNSLLDLVGAELEVDYGGANTFYRRHYSRFHSAFLQMARDAAVATVQPPLTWNSDATWQIAVQVVECVDAVCDLSSRADACSLSGSIVMAAEVCWRCIKAVLII